MRFWLVVCAAPVQRIQQLLECVTVYRASKGISHFAKKGQLATIVEWTVNQNCCFPKQLRCQIIINFTVTHYIVTVFSAQISGAARFARYALGGGRGVGNGTGRWKKITGNCSTRLLLRPCFVWLLFLNANASFWT